VDQLDLQFSSGAFQEERTHTREVHIGSIGDCCCDLMASALKMGDGTSAMSKVSGMIICDCGQQQREDEARCLVHENVDVSCITTVC